MPQRVRFIPAGAFANAFLALFLFLCFGSSVIASETPNSGTTVLSNSGGSVPEYWPNAETASHYPGTISTSHSWIVHWALSASTGGSYISYDGWSLTINANGTSWHPQNQYPLTSAFNTFNWNGSFQVVGNQPFTWEIDSAHVNTYTATISWWCTPVTTDNPAASSSPASPPGCVPGSGPANPTASQSVDPVRYCNGQVIIDEADLETAAFVPWGHSRSYNNLMEPALNLNGVGWYVDQLPSLVQSGTNGITVVLNANSSIAFINNAGAYSPLRFTPGTLLATTGDLCFTDVSGASYHFYDFTAAPMRLQVN